MAIKKELFVMSVVFDDRETYAESAMEAISHKLYNVDGVLEWDYKLLKEEELVADLTSEDLDLKVDNIFQ